MASRKHIIHNDFSKKKKNKRNCEVCKRTKMTRAPLQEAKWRSSTSKVLNEGGESQNNHRYSVVVQDLATQWIQSYPSKAKTSQETERSLRKFLDPREKQKVIYTVNSLELANLVKTLSWNNLTSTPIDVRRMTLLKEQFAEQRKEPLQYCCHLALADLWNATAICELFQTSRQMRKHFMNGM